MTTITPTLTAPAESTLAPPSPELEPTPAPTPATAPLPIVNWISPTVTIMAWEDSRLVDLGHELRSEYVERFWLGVLGPATTLLLRRLARGFTERPDGYRIDLADTAQAMGLGRGIGHSSMIGRTLERACQFGACRIESPSVLEVRTLMPTLTARQLRRLPEPVQRGHATWLAAHGRSNR